MMTLTIPFSYPTISYTQYSVKTRQHIRLGIEDDDRDSDQISLDNTLDLNLEVQFNLEGTTGGYSNSYLSELSERGLNNMELFNSK